MRACLCTYTPLHYMYLFVYVSSERGGASLPGRAPVSGVGRRHGGRAAASLGCARGLQHARVESCVPPGVFRQVVAPHEALVAQRAVKALLTRVRAVVTRQLVRPGELLATVGPGTLEGALA